MPEKSPPAYRWDVALAADPGHALTVEAAYPVLDSDGHMLLKDSDHKIVFAAAPGTGCTFTRGAPVTPAAGPVTVTKFPDGCTCTYSTWTGTGDQAWRWERKVNWGCKADHAEIDQRAALTADAVPAGCCPHRIPKTVRCHECAPAGIDAGKGM
jgi:hypothetical protein